MTIHKAHSIAHGSTVLAGINKLDIQLDSEIDNEVTVGSHFPQIAVIRGQKPKAMFSTRDAAGVIDLTGSTGVEIDGTDTFVTTFAKLGADGLPASGSVHRTYTFDKGLLLPKSLSCEHQQDVVVEAEALFLSSDGAASPLTIADDAALPSITRDNLRWTLHSVAIGGVTIGLPKRVQVDFGQNAKTEGSASNVFDTELTQDGVQPKITISGINATAFAAASIPISGKASTHANTTIYLRKRATDGVGFVSGATTEHIAITAAGVAVVQQHSTSGASRGELTVLLTCAWDGTNAPVVFDTSAALP